METKEMLLLTLPQVIDAALTVPEVGLVSYGLLSNILHIICQQMHLEDMMVQYQGAQAVQLQKIWNPDLKCKMPSITEVQRTEISSDAMKVQEKVVVIPDKGSDKFPAMTLAISSKQLKHMDKKINNLQKDIKNLKALPSNSDLFQAVKKKSGDTSPIIDMYQILSLTKRMEATEQAVTKIASFVEEMAGHVYGAAGEGGFTGEIDLKDFSGDEDRKVTAKEASTKEVCGKCKDDICEPLDTPGRCKRKGERVKIPRITMPKPTGIIPSLGISALSDFQMPTPASNVSVEDFPLSNAGTPAPSEYSEAGESKTTTDQYESAVGAQSVPKSQEATRASTRSRLSSVKNSSLPNDEAFEQLRKEIFELRRLVDSLMNKTISVASEEGEDQEMNIKAPPPSREGASKAKEELCRTLQTKIDDVVLNIDEIFEHMNNMDNAFSVACTGITERIDGLQAALKILTSQISQDTEKDPMEEQFFDNLYAVTERVGVLENAMMKISAGLTHLVEENTSKQTKLLSLVRDIDQLKSDKVGREEFTDSLSTKVDLCMISTKVSHEQFNETCEDLSKGLEEALEKLLEQEELWHIAFKEIHEEINGKLEKDAITPFKSFITIKLKDLQLKLQALSKFKREQEAAASKRKFLKDVQCISCDRNVIMRKKLDESLHYSGVPNFPSHKSKAPILAYGMDNLRQQQKCVASRYCGGAHTITTPQQRVNRCNFTFEDSGPKAVPIAHIDLFCDQASVEENGSNISTPVFKKSSSQISNKIDPIEKKGSKDGKNESDNNSPVSKKSSSQMSNKMERPEKDGSKTIVTKSPDGSFHGSSVEKISVSKTDQDERHSKDLR